MSKIVLHGVNWGHRRAKTPLLEASARFSAANPDIQIKWGERSLKGFAAERMEDVIYDYDMIVFDHPFSGAIMDNGYFLPLEKEFPDLLGAGKEALWAGSSLESYRFDGKIWGAPMDAAVMHGLVRKDLLGEMGMETPLNWDETLALAKKARKTGKYVAIACAAPHAFLVFASLYANTGRGLEDDPRNGDLDLDRARMILAAMAELASHGPSEALDWNSIGLHDAMTQSDDVVFSPCEFGYGTYGEDIDNKRLSFSGFAGMKAPYHKGGVLGGAAIGVSSKTKNREAVFGYLRYLLAADTQNNVFCALHGQAAVADAWKSPEIDARFNGFFSAGLPTLEAASIRPRFPGYIPFQMDAGSIVRAACAGEISAAEATAQLNQAYLAEREKLAARNAPLA